MRLLFRLKRIDGRSDRRWSPRTSNLYDESLFSTRRASACASKIIHSLRFGLFTVSLSWLEVLRSIVEGSPFWFLFKCHHLHKSLYLQNTAKINLAEAKDIFLCRQVKVIPYSLIENLTQKVHKYIQLPIYEKQGDLWVMEKIFLVLVNSWVLTRKS